MLVLNKHIQQATNTRLYTNVKEIDGIYVMQNPSPDYASNFGLRIIDKNKIALAMPTFVSIEQRI